MASKHKEETWSTVILIRRYSMANVTGVVLHERKKQSRSRTSILHFPLQPSLSICKIKVNYLPRIYGNIQHGWKLEIHWNIYVILNNFGIWKPNGPGQLWGYDHIILLVKSGITDCKREGLQTAHWGLYLKWQKYSFFINCISAFSL